MNNYRFYAEMEDARSSKAASKRWPAFTRERLEGMAAGGWHCNVIAVLLDEKGKTCWCGNTDKMDAFVAVSSQPNPPVELGTPSLGYLRKRCVRISEELARRLHPNLFKRLEM